jgi:uncharacterized protein with GYD domain
MVIHFNDGTASRYGITRAAALRQVAEKYGTSVSALVTDDCGDRELVWLSEADAANDDGAHAVAEIKAH